jgi:NADH-ubiquinone oxidoreductase chain 5
MGGLIKFLPFTYSAMLAGSLSLLATPFLTAFYSKDLLLELAYGSYSFSGTYAFVLGTVTAGITAFYSVRLLSLVFFTVPNGPRVNYENTHETKLPVIIPFIILALFSIFFGYVASDLFVGVGSDFLGNSVFMHPNKVSIIEAEFSLSPIIKLLPLICTIVGAFSAFFLYNFAPSLLNDLTETSIGRKVYAFLNGKYYFDVVYNHYLVESGLKLGYSLSKNIDRGAIEFLGPHGLAITFVNLGTNIAKLDDGRVTTYALYIVISLLTLTYLTFSSIILDVQIIDARLVIVLFFTLVFTLINSNRFIENNYNPQPSKQKTQT